MKEDIMTEHKGSRKGHHFILGELHRFNSSRSEGHEVSIIQRSTE